MVHTAFQIKLYECISGWHLWLVTGLRAASYWTHTKTTHNIGFVVIIIYLVFVTTDWFLLPPYRNYWNQTQEKIVLMKNAKISLDPFYDNLWWWTFFLKCFKEAIKTIICDEPGLSETHLINNSVCAIVEVLLLDRCFYWSFWVFYFR